MITRIEALNYRCLHYVDQALGPFHVLVGPNASGKTTFLDVIAFLGRVVSDGPEAAVFDRTRNFQDLVWNRTGDSFELAVEARIPPDLREKLSDERFDTVRYEIALVLDREKEEIGIASERVLLKTGERNHARQRNLFPIQITAPDELLSRLGMQGTRAVVTKNPGSNDNFYSEVHPGSGKGWVPSFTLC